MATERKTIPKRIRFEVFKRDGFACQYCGAKAPDVLLEVDHVSPVSKGGADEILNYVTACKDCNAGKSNRELDDQSVLAKQRRQLEELNDRREQLKLMVGWKDGLRELEAEKVTAAVERMNGIHPGWFVNEKGRASIAKMLASMPFDIVIDAIDVTGASVEVVDGNATQETVRGILERVSRIATVKWRDRKDPGVASLYYIRGIARNRCGYFSDWEALQLMRDARAAGATIEQLTDLAKNVRNWSGFRDELYAFISEKGG